MKIDLQQLNTVRPLRSGPASAEQQVAGAQEVQETFRKFVGEVFFGQLLKSMRSTQGKPAYFHGGQAEEVFRSQLDQTLAQHMTDASADTIADPMFEQQFPAQVVVLKQSEANTKTPLSDLAQLRRF